MKMNSLPVRQQPRENVYFKTGRGRDELDKLYR